MMQTTSSRLRSVLSASLQLFPDLSSYSRCKWSQADLDARHGLLTRGLFSGSFINDSTLTALALKASERSTITLRLVVFTRIILRPLGVMEACATTSGEELCVAICLSPGPKLLATSLRTQLCALGLAVFSIQHCRRWRLSLVPVKTFTRSTWRWSTLEPFFPAASAVMTKQKASSSGTVDAISRMAVMGAVSFCNLFCWLYQDSALRNTGSISSAMCRCCALVGWPSQPLPG